MLNLSDIQAAAAKLFNAITSSGNHLTPAVMLQINGQPFGSGTMSRIISVQLTDNRGFEADELTIELDDTDGRVGIPPLDSKIKCWLGYHETGVVYKGEFKMSEFTHSGAPDKLSITARAADLADTLAEQQEKSWHKLTLYQIVEQIAKRHGYQYRIAEDYKQTQISHIDQTSESDASFLTRLANLHDAIATVKNGLLLFMPKGRAQTASGQPVPAVELTRRSGDNHSFTYSNTEAYNAVRAYYIDKKTGKKEEVIINKDNVVPVKKTQTITKKYKTKRKDGKTHKTTTKVVNVTKVVSADGLKIKTLRHLYASKQAAESGARAAFKRIKRGAAEFKINLAAGRPDIYPETPVNVSGFKDGIDNEKWLVARITHSVGNEGYTSTLELESLLDLG
ncbi:contractile injection system protein, VgrG/Pvc8 family [Neisseria sp. S1]|uniref:contractile injection system protein, VgrG/Pvc8 family n=1 Tax=Neisseria sp. S1 TaxID=3318354 RepID=UPI003A8AB784